MSNDIKPGEISAALTYCFALAFFLFLLSGMAGCASRDAYCGLDRPDVASQSAYIVDGALSTDARSTYLIEMRGPEGLSLCTATRVGEFTLMTAAHCVDNGVTDIDVYREYEGRPRYFGSTDEFEMHPDYDRGKGIVNSKQFEADLAVVWFDFPLPGPVASIAEAPNGCYPGLTVQGYGRSSFEAFDSVGVLRERVVYERLHNSRTIWTTEGSCKGDSGGPLYAETPEGYTVIGVTSFSKECAEGKRLRKSPGYTNLFTYGHWVRERAY